MFCAGGLLAFSFIRRRKIIFCTREPRWLARMLQQQQNCPARGSKFLQEGRSERRPEEVHTALRVGRLPLQGILANGKAPKVLPTSEGLLFNMQSLDDERTPHGKRRSRRAGVGRVRKVTFSASCYSGTRISIQGGLSSIMSEKHRAVLLAGIPGRTAPRRI
jgi:hypothetical protein